MAMPSDPVFQWKNCSHRLDEIGEDCWACAALKSMTELEAENASLRKLHNAVTEANVDLCKQLDGSKAENARLRKRVAELEEGMPETEGGTDD